MIQIRRRIVLPPIHPVFTQEKPDGSHLLYAIIPANTASILQEVIALIRRVHGAGIVTRTPAEDQNRWIRSHHLSCCLKMLTGVAQIFDGSVDITIILHNDVVQMRQDLLQVCRERLTIFLHALD
jgi:hypothetical protein